MFGVQRTSVRRQPASQGPRKTKRQKSKDKAKAGERAQVQKEKDGGSAKADMPKVEKEYMVWDPM